MSNFKFNFKHVLLLAIIFIIAACCTETLSEPVVVPDSKVDIKHASVDFSESCMQCHAEVSPDIYSDWKSSGHGILNYGCYICHGDGETEFYPVGSEDKCISCHSKSEGHLARMEYTGCYDCHDGHTLKAN